MDHLKIFATIIKRDDEKRMVYGYASTEAMDSQGERVSKAAIEAALPDYMRWANVREMHQASAVGVTKSAEIDEKGLYIQAKIVDDAAWGKVKEEVYKGFSIGGKSVAKTDDTITELKLTEISLVDRPANSECAIELWKSEDGKPVPVPLEKAAVEELAALINGGKISTQQLLELAKKATAPTPAAAEPTEKREFSDKKRKELADKGHALPDGSFPIENTADLKNAIKAFGRAKDKAKAKAHIIARAKDLKATDELPDDWKKAEGAGDIAKGLYQVSWLANLLDTIACLQRENAFEQEMEGDGDSTCPAALKDWLEQGLAILDEMVDEESAELMGVTRTPNVPEPEKEAAAGAEGLEKAGAKFSAASKAKMAEAHGHIKKAAGHMAKARGAPVAEADAHLDKCEKCIGKADTAMTALGYNSDTPTGSAKDDDETDKNKLEKSGDALKTMLTPVDAPPKSELDELKSKVDLVIQDNSALRKENAEARKENAELKQRLKALEDQPLPAKGPTRAVGKTEDNGTGEPAPAMEPVRNADGTVDEAATAMKKAQADSPILIGGSRQVSPWNLPRRTR